ncbi:MAG: DUF3299 domain-containing protein [Paraglaciecola sp.]|nr:DUF3299 domain-containing protein [Paraglaciecola sp.]
MKQRLNNKLRIIFTLTACMGLGVLLGRLGIDYWPTIKQAVVLKKEQYSTSNKTLNSRYHKEKTTVLDWAYLLPKEEHEVMTRYQSTNPKNLEQMTAQVLLSINSSTDQNYQNALISTNTVDRFEKKMVSISGFAVPIDFYDDKSVKSFFFVPYFGACIHLPAPPPNQMIFVQLEPGFKDIDITQTYTLTGSIGLALFEDPMGTSAYTLDVVKIVEFYGQSDDFRRH